MKAKTLYWTACGFTKASRHNTLLKAILNKEMSGNTYIYYNRYTYNSLYNYNIGLETILYFYKRSKECKYDE
jgi:hypothetical protein